MDRIDKINYYLDIAQTVAERGTCLRRLFGAVIVKNDIIVSTGYVGAPRGRENCCDRGICFRQEMNIPRGQRYELCRSVHAEANAIIAASREAMLDATLYMSCIDAQTKMLAPGTTSCSMCQRLIINAGISTIVIRDSKEDFRVINVSDWITEDDSLSGIFGY